jgi:hypothetical protein
MNMNGLCEDCDLCSVCGRHLVPENQWPCLYDGRMLCGSCECPTEHVEEPTA